MQFVKKLSRMQLALCFSRGIPAFGLEARALAGGAQRSRRASAAKNSPTYQGTRPDTKETAKIKATKAPTRI